MLRIVAIRHAQPASEGYAEDFLRPLSQEGRANQRIAAQKLEKEGIVPTAIWSSPLLRAEQTAEILAEYFSISYRIEPALGGAFNGTTLLRAFPAPSANETLFLVGHMPALPDFVNELVGEQVVETLPKSGSAVVEFQDAVAFGKGIFKGRY